MRLGHCPDRIQLRSALGEHHIESASHRNPHRLQMWLTGWRTVPSHPPAVLVGPSQRSVWSGFGSRPSIPHASFEISFDAYISVAVALGASEEKCRSCGCRMICRVKNVPQATQIYISECETRVAKLYRSVWADPDVLVHITRYIRSEERRVGKECRSRWS